MNLFKKKEKNQEQLKEDKTPFKERKAGKLLAKVAPHILDIVKDSIPDRGIIGIVKNLVIRDKTIPASDKEEIDKMLDIEMEQYELYLSDLADSRDMYKTTSHEMADDIARKVIKWNLWVVLLAIIIEVIFVVFVDDKILIAIISGAIGAVTNSLLNERQQIINFFFGSSRGSKDKSIKLGL